jgi:hypothetical protein
MNDKKKQNEQKKFGNISKEYLYLPIVKKMLIAKKKNIK